ncbi:MAG: hypothetical protein EOP90_12665 [Lysobacteraceae bacterium]|nr:MAG: hypothetical protein EOP90_12665 [Xanthomonadaceae bacterium]
MSREPRLASLHRRALRRRVAIVLACALPPLAAIVAVCAMRASIAAAGVLAIAGIAIAAWVASRAVRRLDARWLARALDAALPRLEDSAALLLREPSALKGLEPLQRARLATRLARATPDLREAWPRRAVGLAAALAFALLAIGIAWPTRKPVDANGPAAAATASRALATRIVQAELAIEPPAYTRLPARREGTLDAKAPEGSQLHWRLRFDPQPSSASLAFHDGERVPLERDGEAWRAQRRLEASALYRITLEGAPPPEDDRLHRLDAIADRAPEVRVIRPERSLTLVEPGQQRWELEFEADDDHALADPMLSLTLARGGGENVTFSERDIAPAIEEVDGRRQQRYRHSLDLGTLGIAAGDDVIVRLRVADNREPEPNTTRSPSFILRWPAEAAGDGAGLEGVVQHVLPAYFRSQRQIIIDTEALLAEQPRPAPDRFLARSDALGVDQRVLRLRYGQFLGEETETPQPPAGDTHAQGEAHDGAQAPVDAHGHDAPAPGRFGDAADVVAEYGHVHDIAEAATLLDPETKETLRAALAEMWQSELHLRQGEPHLALPYEYRALDLIKRVQQSTRIYLARVGLELPAPDESRRLGGDREGVPDRAGTLPRAPAEAAPLRALWQSLDAGEVPDWEESLRWIAANRAKLPDALGLIAAIDAARRDPACANCSAQVRGLLWRALPPLPAQSAARVVPDAAGRTYLDALHDAGGDR